MEKIITLLGKSLHFHQNSNEKHNLDYHHASMGNDVNVRSNNVHLFELGSSNCVKDIDLHKCPLLV